MKWSVLLVVGFCAVVASAKEFECPKDDAESFLQMAEGVGQGLSPSELKKKIEANFKEFKHVVPTENGAIGWNALTMKTLDVKFRFKFDENTKKDKIWAVKFDVFNSKVPSDAKGMSHALTKMHNSMQEKNCKTKDQLAQVSLHLSNWQIESFAKTAWYKPSKYGSDDLTVTAKVGISLRAYYNTETGKWMPGKESDVRMCLEDVDVKSSGGKTFLMKLFGGLTKIFPFEDKLLEWFVVPSQRKSLYCSLVDKPNGFFAGLANAKYEAEKQIKILTKCAAGGCSKDFDPTATKELLTGMQALKHGAHITGGLGMKGTQLAMMLKMDVETKSDSMIEGMLVSDGLITKANPDTTAQALQATQWIAAQHLSTKPTPPEGMTAVHELYGETYRKMAKAFLEKFGADPKMAGYVQAGMDAVYDSQSNVLIDLNGKLSLLPGSPGKLNLEASKVALNAAIPSYDPMTLPMDLVLNRPIDQWDFTKDSKMAQVSGKVGFDLSDSKLDGPLTTFIDEAAETKDKATAKVMKQGNKILSHMLANGARLVLDSSRDSGLHWDKNFLRFHGDIEVDGPSNMDETIVMMASELGRMQDDIEALAKANLERNKKTTSLLLLQLTAGEKCTRVAGKCLGKSSCEGGKQQTGLCPGKTVCCIAAEKPVTPLTDAVVSSALATTDSVDATKTTVDFGDWQGDLEKAKEWAAANKVEYAKEQRKCLLNDPPSFMELGAAKEKWYKSIMPRFEVLKSGPNKGKFKCKSAEEKVRIPAYIFRTELSATSVVGARDIVFTAADFSLNVEYNKDSQELQIWLTSASGPGKTVGFEDYKAVARQCTANAASKAIFSHVHLDVKDFQMHFLDKLSSGYSGDGTAKMRLGLALSLKNVGGQWTLKREDVVSCLPEDKDGTFWKLYLSKLGLHNFENYIDGGTDDFTVKNFHGDLRSLVSKYAHDSAYCGIKQQLSGESMVPKLLDVLKGTKVEKGAAGFKLKVGMKLNGNSKRRDKRNLRTFVKGNFNLKSNTFVHTVLSQGAGMKVKPEDASKDAMALLKAYAAKLEADEKTKKMGASVHRAAAMWFGSKHSYEFTAQGGLEYKGNAADSKDDWLKIVSDRIGIKGSTSDGHILFPSILLPVDGLKAVLGDNSVLETNKFIVSTAMDMGADQLEFLAPAGQMIDDAIAAINAGEDAKLDKKKIFVDYMLNYFKRNGLDVHAYLGDKKDHKKPGFFMDKETAKGAFDLYFNGPADVTKLMNFVMAHEKKAKQLLEESMSAPGKVMCASA
jgi:hypothetical protein